jgi:hypothetical protein
LCNFAQYGHSKSEYSIHVIFESTLHLIYESSFIFFNSALSNNKNPLSLLSAKGLNTEPISKINSHPGNGFKKEFTFGVG